MIKINRMMHTGLIVADVARSRAFYEGVLGFTPNPARPDFDFAGVWYDIGANQVHLMQVPNPYENVQRPAHGGRDTHIAFAVDDVAPVRAELDKAGISYSMSKSGVPRYFAVTLTVMHWNFPP